MMRACDDGALGAMPANDERIEILFVEDNPGDVLLLREALDELEPSYHLTVAPDGEVAIARLRRDGRYEAAPRPDLVLLDLNLPRMSGLEVLTVIRQERELATLPVVVFTSSYADRDVRDCYALGANLHVTKPADLEHFFAAARTIRRFLRSFPKAAPAGESS